MAVTKIHGIKTTVDKAIEYICNPDKTDQNLYISSFACSPETAVLDFKYTLDHTHDCRDPHNTNKAFHLIQAFSPGEVSYEEAHQIGKELADRLLEEKYSYVLTTHTDKGHVHNHLIFCSADNITFSHYHDCKKNYWKIRNLSDTLCQEHNLSTIMPDGKKGMKYNEYRMSRIIFYLFSNVADMSHNNIVITRIGFIPDYIIYLFFTKHSSRTSH